ncbi:hypothetical protein AB3N58_09360 [Leptospira sp. WS60.C2]
MLRSLAEKDPSAKVYVFPFDEACFSALKKLNLSFVELVSLSDFESADLLRVKQERTKGEYCWTCTPWILRYCFDTFSLDHCTYIDADLYFFSNPQVLLEETKESSVMITEHRYTPKYDQSATSGIYCVQFVFFRNDSDGKNVLHWWADKCLEWCYARFEDGKFGDQKYLDHWPSQFNRVHVLKHLGGGVAPWNVQQYTLIQHQNDEIILEETKTKKPFYLVFYHFHDVKLESSQISFYGNSYFIHEKMYGSIYAQYSKALNSNYSDIQHYQISSETVIPIINDFAHRLNYDKSVKEGSLTETHLFLSFDPNLSTQKKYQFNFPCSAKIQELELDLPIHETSISGPGIFQFIFLPMKGSANECKIKKITILGTSLEGEDQTIVWEKKVIQKLANGNWQKRNGNSFFFYSTHGFLTFPLRLKKIHSITMNIEYRWIDPIEAAMEISKLSPINRILKKIGL